MSVYSASRVLVIELVSSLPPPNPACNFRCAAGRIKSLALGLTLSVETHDTQYAEALKRFDDVVSASTALSQGSAGIPAPSSRHYWASVLFTRLTGNGVSLLPSLPRNRLTKAAFENWDFAMEALLGDTTKDGET